MKESIASTKTIIKKIFKKDQKFSNSCKICNMKFTDPERTKKHMIKAHSKPKRENSWFSFRFIWQNKHNKVKHFLNTKSG